MLEHLLVFLAAGFSYSVIDPHALMLSRQDVLPLLALPKVSGMVGSSLWSAFLSQHNQSGAQSLGSKDMGLQEGAGVLYLMHLFPWPCRHHSTPYCKWVCASWVSQQYSSIPSSLHESVKTFFPDVFYFKGSVIKGRK